MTEYEPKTVVWAKLSTYPFWPAVVGTQSHTVKLQNYYNKPGVAVLFLGKKKEWGLIKTQNIELFSKKHYDERDRLLKIAYYEADSFNKDTFEFPSLDLKEKKRKSLDSKSKSIENKRRSLYVQNGDVTKRQKLSVSTDVVYATFKEDDSQTLENNIVQTTDSFKKEVSRSATENTTENVAESATENTTKSVAKSVGKNVTESVAKSVVAESAFENADLVSKTSEIKDSLIQKELSQAIFQSADSVSKTSEVKDSLKKKDLFQSASEVSKTSEVKDSLKKKDLFQSASEVSKTSELKDSLKQKDFRQSRDSVVQPVGQETAVKTVENIAVSSVQLNLLTKHDSEEIQEFVTTKDENLQIKIQNPEQQEIFFGDTKDANLDSVERPTENKKDENLELPATISESEIQTAAEEIERSDQSAAITEEKAENSNQINNNESEINAVFSVEKSVVINLEEQKANSGNNKIEIAEKEVRETSIIETSSTLNLAENPRVTENAVLNRTESEFIPNQENTPAEINHQIITENNQTESEAIANQEISPAQINQQIHSEQQTELFENNTANAAISEVSNAEIKSGSQM